MTEGWDDSKCCCHFPDARECFRSRYSVDPDDHGGENDGSCECCCHAEYENYWRDRDDENHEIYWSDTCARYE